MIDDRVSIDYRKYKVNNNIFESNDAYFLKDDLRLGIEVLDDRIRKEFQVYIEPNNALVEQNLLKIIPHFSDYHSRNLKDHFLKLIDFLALGLIDEGFFILERVKITEENSSYFYLVPIDYDEIIVKKNFIYQCFSKTSQEKFNLPKRIKINKDKCYILEFPSLLGGSRYYQELLREISLSDRFVNRSFLEMKKMSGKLPFYNFSEHNKISDFYAWKISRKIGWHHRTYNSYEQPGTEHYKFSRRLKFKRTSLIIRNYTVENIKHIYEDIAKHLGVQIRVIVKGLTDLSEIESAISKWYKGELDFEDISNYTLI